MPDLQSSDNLDRLELALDGWFHDQLESNPAVASVERDVPGTRRWFVRLAGEEKDFSTVRFELGQRTLYFETYVMPWPIENEAEFFAHLLRRNHKLFGAKLSIGDEDGIYLEGHLDNSLINTAGGTGDRSNGGEGALEAELDRVLGSIYVWVEQFFRPALRIGFASKFS